MSELADNDFGFAVARVLGLKFENHNCVVDTCSVVSWSVPIAPVSESLASPAEQVSAETIHTRDMSSAIEKCPSFA